MTTFERNLMEATEKLIKFGARETSGLEVSKAFFGGAEEFPPLLKDYKPEPGKKNAIVLIGLSCTGKSTYAKKFVVEHPDFEYLSMDDCALTELAKTGVIMCLDGDIRNNTLGNQEFGERIEKGQNLIIDGGWVHINSRSALLKTLKEFGYRVCACVFTNITRQELIRNVEARITSQMAYEMLKKKPEYANKNWVEVYRKESKLSREVAVRSIRSTAKYRRRLIEEINVLAAEKEETDYMMQLETGLIIIGFDAFMVV